MLIPTFRGVTYRHEIGNNISAIDVFWPQTFTQRLESRMKPFTTVPKEAASSPAIQSLISTHLIHYLRKHLERERARRKACLARVEITEALLKCEIQQEVSNSEVAQAALWVMCSDVVAHKHQKQSHEIEICRLHEELQDEQQKSAAALLAAHAERHACEIETNKTIKDLRAEAESLKERLIHEQIELEQCRRTKVKMNETLEENLVDLQLTSVSQADQIADDAVHKKKLQEKLDKAEKEISLLTQRCDNLRFTLVANPMCMSSEDDPIQLEEEAKEAKAARDDALKLLEIEPRKSTPLSVMLDIIAEMEHILHEKTEQMIYYHSDLRRVANIRASRKSADERWGAKLVALKARLMAEQGGLFEVTAHEADPMVKEVSYAQGATFEMVVR